MLKCFLQIVLGSYGMVDRFKKKIYTRSFTYITSMVDRAMRVLSGPHRFLDPRTALHELSYNLFVTSKDETTNSRI